MQYFFILGNTPAVSMAELLGWLSTHAVEHEVKVATTDFVIIETTKNLPHTLLEQLGGSSKFGEVHSHQTKVSNKIVKEFVQSIVEQKTAAVSTKFHFGFSVYPLDKKIAYQLRGVGLQLKKVLTAQGVSSRLVMSKQENLSSVIVQKNKLVSDAGVEFVVLQHGKSDVWLGTTIAVQPFEALSKRDFGRPGRDDYSGMLPPKLAQMLINIAKPQPGSVILDPFCGSGTVLQEALLMGYEHVQGSDVSNKAVADTKQNIQWLAQKYSVDISAVSVRQFDVRKLQAKQSVDRIVTEPYLGPPARGSRSPQEVEKIAKELTKLYTDAFVAFEKILAPNGRVVIVFPVLQSQGKQVFLPIQDIVAAQFQLENPLPKSIQPSYTLSDRGTLLYDRGGQSVQREIIVCSYV